VLRRVAERKTEALDKLTTLKWKVVIAVMLVDALWISVSNFHFVSASAAKVGAIVAMLLAVAWFSRVKRPPPKFEIMCSETALLIAFSSAGAVLSYLVTSWNFPLIDGKLVQIDGILGFDWIRYVAFVNTHTALSVMSSVVYATTTMQIALCIIALSFTGRLLRAQHLGTAVLLGGLMCVLIAGGLPSSGALGHFKPSADFVASGAPFVDLQYKQAFFDLRSGAERLISLDAMRGLVAFPSFHATLSVLVIIALWPFRSWRWPVCLLNFCILLATPVDGGHHLIDALGGAALALFSWQAAAWVMSRYPSGADRLTVAIPGGEPAAV
jgi:hypothetical protein